MTMPPGGSQNRADSADARPLTYNDAETVYQTSLTAARDVIASATGVGPADAGLASGLINPSQQIGGTIGIAVTTTIAAARTATLLHSGRPLHVALTGGFHDAFAVAAGLAVAGAIVAFALIRRPAAVPAAAAQGNATR